MAARVDEADPCQPSGAASARHPQPEGHGPWGGRCTALVAALQRHRVALLAISGLALSLAGTAAVRAQSNSPNQPLAIEGLPPAPCPLLVPRSQYFLQPLRIQPSQVAGKNAMGCLSPSDAALYGPDGCPVKLCKAPQGTVPLPQL